MPLKPLYIYIYVYSFKLYTPNHVGCNPKRYELILFDPGHVGWILTVNDVRVVVSLSFASSPTACALPLGPPKVKEGQVSLKSGVAGDDFMDTTMALTGEKDDGTEVKPQVEGEKVSP